jgi:diguanylate cyclase (GGDEF)-like protein/PAS domain S-box-containing protein
MAAQIDGTLLETADRVLDLRTVRARASLGFSLCLWLLVPVIYELARSNGLKPNAVTLLLIGAAALSTTASFFGGASLWCRLAGATALTFAPICLVWAGSGAWQVDYHMTFFVVFAALVAYVDWRPIALSAALTAAHHLLLDLVARDVVFPEESPGRVALHGVVVFIECGVLFWIVFQMRRLFAEAQYAIARAESASDRLGLFQAAIAQANESIFIAKDENLSDHRVRVLYANPALEIMTGHDAGELVGKTTEFLRGPQTDSAKIELLFFGARDGIRRVVEIVYYDREGESIECEASASTILDEAGRMSHIVCVIRDIRVRKAAESALLEARIAQEKNAVLQREIVRRELVEHELMHAAFHDPLTGLPNRTLFYDRLQHAVKRTIRHGTRHVAVLFLDCDRFKVVNDSFGHTTGDLLLAALARRLKGHLRPGDTLARLGGDEFTILLEDIADESEAIALADRVLQTFDTPFSLGGKELFASASIGIALNNIGTESADDLMRNADIAMYRAKSAGKRRHALFLPELADEAIRRLQLETALRTAIEREELSIHYQAIMTLDVGRVAGFEALLRWHHAELGPISPVDFIPIAEETGLIGSIGAWVMRNACLQLRTWQSEIRGAEGLTMNVNVSASQLLDAGFVAATAHALTESGIAPHTLHIEITESVLMKDPDRISGVLNELRALGPELHLDDFGTGYSSLAYLHRFPVNALKIDKSFVSGIGAGLANPEIVETVIALARQLSLKVTAEGIETTEQDKQLRALNCSSAQGYLFSKPLNSVATKAYLIAQLELQAAQGGG